jgi:hypothetical protein
MKPRKVGRSTTNLPQSQARYDTNYKNNNKKQSNKGLCPFACPNCQSSLGGDLVKSKYEIVNILSDTGDSIFSPMDERYHDEEDYRLIRNGKVFLSADLVNSFLQKDKK